MSGKHHVPVVLLLVLLAFAAGARGGDVLPPPASAAGPDLTDVFDFSQATRPRPGDWLEYLVAFPADPLENSLRSRPGASSAGVPEGAPGNAVPAVPGDGTVDFDAVARIRPEFEPPAAWRGVPVRLEIREVFPDGCNADVSFAGERVSVRLAAGNGAQAEFHYDAGGEAERSLRIGDREYTVRELRRAGSDYGFVRWFSAEVPFGLVRFATEHVDIQLVAMGWGAPPDFPVRLVGGIAPALGSLY